jgi:CheY-like chemotaxis protein
MGAQVASEVLILRRILVVDDDQQIRFMLRMTLEREGYELEEAADGKTALALLARQSFDLVITDIIMPGKEGIQVIKEMKRDQPDLKIIAISGGGYVSASKYLDSATDFGADLTLNKPLSRADLLKAVYSLLAAGNQEREAAE